MGALLGGIPGLTNTADVATIVGTSVVVWGIATRTLTRWRREGALARFTRADVQRGALTLAVIVALLVANLLGSVSSIRLEEQNRHLQNVYGQSVVVVEHFGSDIAGELCAIHPDRRYCSSSSGRR